MKTKNPYRPYSIDVFSDRMMIDKCGRLGQEPWMYTLGIFNRNVRNQPSVWQNLGLTKYNTQHGYTSEQIKQSHSN